ncbi:GDSL esterase/lipase At5g45960-like [Rhododendron vialii]|uniref:GDSL esterase/lipase At5g45960-like n=1 Tax=Rhododendron vialii TaxID=182163 RepID=UPI00265E61E4|nr:GDSL esterase/lipase At5g45960-like [Rhododendron vialii]
MFRSLYSFGDSFVDPGNNNYILTYAKSNFPHTVAISQTELPQEVLKRAVGPQFSGWVFQILFLIRTLYFLKDFVYSKAIQIVEQFNNFKKYKVKLQKKVGRKKAQEQIKYASAGMDDFAFTYFQDGRRTLTPPQYQCPPQYEQFLVARIRLFLQGLVLDQGARKIAVNGLPLLGCIPIVIFLTPTNPPFAPRSQRKCLDYVNAIVKDFNALLREALIQLQRKWPETKIAYIDFEEPLLLQESKDNPADSDAEDADADDDDDVDDTKDADEAAHVFEPKPFQF